MNGLEHEKGENRDKNFRRSGTLKFPESPVRRDVLIIREFTVQISLGSNAKVEVYILLVVLRGRQRQRKTSSFPKNFFLAS